MSHESNAEEGRSDSKASRGMNWFYLKVLGPLSVIGGAVALLVWVFDVFNTGNDPATKQDFADVLNERMVVDRAELEVTIARMITQQRAAAPNSSARNGDQVFDSTDVRLISASANDVLTSSDERKQPARVALASGEPSRAAQLLEAVAEGQSASEDEHAAALSWQEAAAFYWLQNPVKARRALDQAYNLDPENYRTQLLLAMLALRTGDEPGEAWAMAQGAVGAAQTTEEKAAALHVQGQAMLASGELAGAAQSLGEAAQLYRAQLRVQPDDATSRIALRDTQKELYTAYLAAEDYSNAVEAIEEALDISRDIARLDPTVENRRQVSLMLVWLGDALSMQEDGFLAARAAFTEAVALERARADAATGDLDILFNLLFPLKRLGDHERGTDNEAARAAYLQMLDIEETLATGPEAEFWEGTLPFRHMRLAGLGGPESDGHKRAAFDIMKSLHQQGRLSADHVEWMEQIGFELGISPAD